MSGLIWVQTVIIGWQKEKQWNQIVNKCCTFMNSLPESDWAWQNKGPICIQTVWHSDWFPEKTLKTTNTTTAPQQTTKQHEKLITQ